MVESAFPHGSFEVQIDRDVKSRVRLLSAEH
jgi:hypothetical protein